LAKHHGAERQSELLQLLVPNFSITWFTRKPSAITTRPIVEIGLSTLSADHLGATFAFAGARNKMFFRGPAQNCIDCVGHTGARFGPCIMAGPNNKVRAGQNRELVLVEPPWATRRRVEDVPRRPPIEQFALVHGLSWMPTSVRDPTADGHSNQRLGISAGATVRPSTPLRLTESARNPLARSSSSAAFNSFNRSMPSSGTAIVCGTP